jgi:hypothetical protein
VKALPPVVYVAGKFRAPTPEGIAENVRAAERWALRIAQAGAMPLCPHANNGHFYGQLPEQFWLNGTLSLLAKCDAAVFIPHWTDSEGACAEHLFCEQNHIQLFGAAHVRSGDFARWVEQWISARTLGREFQQWLARHTLDDVDPDIEDAADREAGERAAAQLGGAAL